MRASLCIYCGKSLPNKVRPSVKAEESAAIAAEFAALHGTTPDAPSIGGVTQWVIRIGAVGIAGLLVFGLVGPCLKS